MKEEAMVITKEPALDTVETCITKGIHRDTIRSVKKAMPDPIHLYDLADLFKLFGDSTRLGILWALRSLCPAQDETTGRVPSTQKPQADPGRQIAQGRKSHLLFIG